MVGIDARQGPIDAASAVHYRPDLIIDATKTTPEEVVKEIDALREPGWDYGSGADGES